MYAIVDIETTGGKFNEEGITEIAIYKFDGHEIIDQFITLVNPEKDIQPFVVNLTGINNKMLRNAPKFYEIAKRIVEITKDCILVAHNTSFDYRILRTEFRRLGFEFTRRNLCTVVLSKKLLPEQEKYNLGKLVKALGIPMTDRHRASGDALATVELFKVLLAKDVEKTILTQNIKSGIEQKIKSKYSDILDGLSSQTGVYYIHQEDGTIIYIGKSNNIRKSVNKHFTKSFKTNKKIQKLVHKVTYEETGSELIAVLKEAQEIEKNSPILNGVRRNKLFQFGLYRAKTENGYFALKYSKLDRRKKTITAFTSEQEAQDFITKITGHYGLDTKINYAVQYPTQAILKEKEEDPETYNLKVVQFINEFEQKSTNRIIVDKGRNPQENCAILLEDGKYKGYCFFKLNHQIQHLDILKKLIIPMEHSQETLFTIQSYIRKKRVKKIIQI